MDAETALNKTNECRLNNYPELEVEYTQLIYNYIDESIKQGKTYYETTIVNTRDHKYDCVDSIVKQKFIEKGFRFSKHTGIKYFRWDDKPM